MTLTLTRLQEAKSGVTALRALFEASESFGLNPVQAGDTNNVGRPCWLVVDLGLGSPTQRYQTGLYFRAVFTTEGQRAYRQTSTGTVDPEMKDASGKGKGTFGLARSTSEADLQEGEGGWHIAEGGTYSDRVHADPIRSKHHSGKIDAVGCCFGVEKLVALVSSFAPSLLPQVPEVVLTGEASMRERATIAAALWRHGISAEYLQGTDRATPAVSHEVCTAAGVPLLVVVNPKKAAVDEISLRLRPTGGGGGAHDKRLGVDDLPQHAKTHLKATLEAATNPLGDTARDVGQSPLPRAEGVGREDSPLRSYLPNIELLGAEGKRAKENKDSKDTVKMRRRAEALLAGLGDKDVVAKAYLVALPYLILRQFISYILSGDDHAKEKLIATCPKEQKRQCQLLTEALAQLQTSSSNASGAVFLFSTHDELFDLVPLAAVTKARR